jgi:hypothetical protein
MNHMSESADMFLKIWDAFTLTLRGKLLRAGKGLTHPNANMLLHDSMLAWLDPSEKEGAYMLELPDNIRPLLEQILARDMVFQNITAGIGNGKEALYTAATAGAGLLITSLLRLPLPVRAVGSALAAAGTYGCLRNGKKSNGLNNQADAYLLQLDKYKKAVLNVLQNQS